MWLPSSRFKNNRGSSLTRERVVCHRVPAWWIEHVVWLHLHTHTLISHTTHIHLLTTYTHSSHTHYTHLSHTTYTHLSHTTYTHSSHTPHTHISHTPHTHTSLTHLHTHLTNHTLISHRHSSLYRTHTLISHTPHTQLTHHTHSSHTAHTHLTPHTHLTYAFISHAHSSPHIHTHHSWPITFLSFLCLFAQKPWLSSQCVPGAERSHRRWWGCECAVCPRGHARAAEEMGQPCVSCLQPAGPGTEQLSHCDLIPVAYTFERGP